MIVLDLPLPPSINACYANNIYGGKGRRLTAEGRQWKYAAGVIANAAKSKQGFIYPKPDEKVIVLLWAFWPDKRTRDMNNLHKVLLDAFEGVLYDNDKMVLVRDMDFFYRSRQAGIITKILTMSEFELFKLRGFDVEKIEQQGGVCL